MRFPDFQPCLFVVSENGEVLNFEPHFKEWLGNQTMAIKGQSMATLLGSINPAWGILVPESPSKLPKTLFLPWDNPDGTDPHFGLNIGRISYEQLHFLTLSPKLANDWVFGDEGTDKTLPLANEVMRNLALRATHAETRLETYMANFPGTFFSQRPDLSFNYLGQGAGEMLFQKTGSLLKNGGLFLNAINEDDRGRFVDVLRSNSKTPGRFSLSYQIRNPESGEVRYILDVRTAQLTPSGILIGYEGVWLDVTRQAIAENRLSDTVWKENLTHLTNGLAHDFSNLMTGIHSVSDLHLASLDELNPMHEVLKQIKQSSLQAQQLVRRILDLHKDKEVDKTYHDLRNLIEDQLDLCKILLARTTKIELTLPEDPLPVYIDESAFRHTILNLTINARDAMGPEGRIQIVLRKVTAGKEMTEAQATLMGPAPGNGVVMDFADTGCGINPEFLGNIFQPFFTTKESGKGSGFGLYNARIFTNNHRGKIGVNSHVDKGTTFHLYLPLVEE